MMGLEPIERERERERERGLGGRNVRLERIRRREGNHL